jgi:hypothetical protein
MIKRILKKYSEFQIRDEDFNDETFFVIDSIEKGVFKNISVNKINYLIKNFFLLRDNASHKKSLFVISNIIKICLDNPSNKNINILKTILNNKRYDRILDRKIIKHIKKISDQRQLKQIIQIYDHWCFHPYLSKYTNIIFLKEFLGDDLFFSHIKRNKLSVYNGFEAKKIINFMIKNKLDYSRIFFHPKAFISAKNIHRITVFLIKTNQTSNLKLFTKQIINKMLKEKNSSKKINSFLITAQELDPNNFENVITPDTKTLLLLNKKSCFNIETISQLIFSQGSQLSLMSSTNISVTKTVLNSDKQNNALTIERLITATIARPIRINTILLLSELTDISFTSFIDGSKLIQSIESPLMYKFAEYNITKIQEGVSKYNRENQILCLKEILRQINNDKISTVMLSIAKTIPLVSGSTQSIIFSDIESKKFKPYYISDEDFLSFIVSTIDLPINQVFQSDRKLLKKIIYSKVSTKTSFNMYSFFLLYLAFVKKELNEDLTLSLIESEMFPESFYRIIDSAPILKLFNNNFSEKKTLHLFHQIARDSSAAYTVEFPKFCKTIESQGIVVDLSRVQSSLESIFLAVKKLYLMTTYKNLPTNYKIIQKLCGLTIGEFEIYIPKSFYELIDVGQALQNCVANNAGFLYRPKCKDQFIITLVKNGKYKFCIDVCLSLDGSYFAISGDSFKGKSNQDPSLEFVKSSMQGINDHFAALYKPKNK